MLKNPSASTQKIFEPLETHLTVNKFKRTHETPVIHTKQKSYADEVKKYWKQKLGIYVNPVWHQIISSYTNTYNPKYITNEIWSKYIHDSLNFPPYHDPLIADKNLLDLYIGKEYLPKTVIKRIDGYFYDEDNKRIEPKQAKNILTESNSDKFLKPSRLFKGKGAFKIQTRGNKILYKGTNLTFEELIQKSGENFIVQYVVNQHPKIAEVHPSSLNTFRMFTLKLGTTVHYLNGSVKFGADNNVADNTGNGILCSVTKERNTLSDYGYNRSLKMYNKHPTTDFDLSTFGEIPNYQSAIDLCKEIHKTKLFHSFAAWDVAIREDGSPLIIELNSKVDMFLWQIRFNEPFFGELTEEVLDLVKRKFK